MSIVESFPPIIGLKPKMLILGSSPGVISVKKQQYFAHPRNAFWPIMAQLFKLDLSQGYDFKVSQIKQLPIIIWDSLQQCEREGSLDSAIDKNNIKANDFKSLLNTHSNVSHVFCNGGASYQWFKKLALPTLDVPVEVVQLPSTSPAHAAMSFEKKLLQWQQIKQLLESG